MEQILLTYGRPKETTRAIMMLYRRTKVKVRSPDEATDYFDILACVQQGDSLVPYLFIICVDNVLRTSTDKTKDNGFNLTKERSRGYTAHSITARMDLGVMAMDGCSSIPQCSSISGTSPSDYLESYPGHSFGGGVLPVWKKQLGYFTAPYSPYLAPGDFC